MLMGPRHKTLTGAVTDKPMGLFDKWLLWTVVVLVAIGWLMVGSSSVVISQRHFGHPAHYLVRQGCYILLGSFVALFAIRIPTKRWFELAQGLLALSLLSLVLVLIPGIGRRVNGSARWLGVGPMVLQISELVKVVVIIYMASYLSKYRQTVQTVPTGLLKPLALLAVLSLLLLLEPDYGTAVVMIFSVMLMSFLAGAHFRSFFVLLGFTGVCIVGMLLVSPYRLARLTAFLNPWAHQYTGGYQLTQSLIAFGRGGVYGTGLGQSVQKFLYLPEAHTDFLLAVLAEEFGLLGVLMVLILFLLFFFRAMTIASQAEAKQRYFAAYLGYGLACWITLQAMINSGVNMGLLPTKGLTLPFMSAGGSSMLSCAVAVALLLRIDYENRWQA